MTNVFKLFSAAAGNAAAQWIVPFDCRVVAICWSATLDSLADNSTLQAELSLQSTNQITASGISNVIDEMQLYQNVQAAPVGQSEASCNKVTNGIDYPIVANSIVYLNILCTGTLACAVFIHYIRGKA